MNAAYQVLANRTRGRTVSVAQQQVRNACIVFALGSHWSNC
jgi:hypothetical protein